MINFDRMPSDLLWFAKRYNALIVDFPEEITPSILKMKGVCFNYDSEEVYYALISAHQFLSSIAAELYQVPSKDENKKEHIEKVIYKIEALWGLVFLSELLEEGTEYSISFTKPLLKGKRTLPPNYSKPLKNLEDNGCWVEYFKNEKTTKSFNTCDKGILHFENKLTALGVYLFIKRCALKRWYQKEDTAGSYTEKIQFSPIYHCCEPYYRVDMRVFICGDRLYFDIAEELAGCSEDTQLNFKRIYCHIAKHYPDCLPEYGIFAYIYCSITFGVDAKHRMIGQIGVGSHENHLGVYAALTGKEMDALIADIDSFGEKVVMQFLHESDCECYLCKNKIDKIMYSGNEYNRVNRIIENRFIIENEEDVQLAIKCIDIKAKCNMNTRAKQP